MASRVAKQKNLSLSLLGYLASQTDLFQQIRCVTHFKYAKLNPRLFHSNAKAFLAQTGSHVFDITDIGQCGKNA